MRRIFFIILIFGLPILSYCQDSLSWRPDKNKIVIPFKFVNNLIVFPVVVNKVKFQFILDTGVEKSVLFNLENIEELNLFDVEKISLKGLGSGAAFEALKSNNNTMEIEGMKDFKHTLYIISDGDINFSSQLGIPVHGITGYNFFKNNIVEINYSSRKIIVYKSLEDVSRRKLKKYDVLDISIEKGKPYVMSAVVLEEGLPIPVKLLVDSGSTNALFLFEDTNERLKIPAHNFENYLGTGFSGDIYGRRSKVAELYFGKEMFEYALAAFPDDASLQHLSIVQGRNGSVGNEVLKRFSVIFDYRNNRLYYKKNRYFSTPFHYNMSGIDIEHSGKQWIADDKGIFVSNLSSNSTSKFNIGGNDFRYNYVLKPIYRITNVRKDSPGGVAGLLKDDILVSINNRPAYRYSIQQITDLLQSEEGRVIKMQVRRKNQVLEYEFRLKNIL